MKRRTIGAALIAAIGLIGALVAPSAQAETRPPEVISSEALAQQDLEAQQIIDELELLVIGPFAGVCTISGTDGDDVLVGTKGPDVICGGDGNDLIIGGDGNDVLRGGHGEDTIRGGRGFDRIDGGPDADRIFGGRAVDFIQGGSGPDRIDGGPGDDRIDGGFGDDDVRGGDDDDVIIDLFGNDTINGDAGNDRLDGGPGDDIIIGMGGADVLVGSTGADRIYGGSGSDKILSGRGEDASFGGPGDDLLRGGGENDELDGGDGFDSLNGGGGSDICTTGEVEFSCEGDGASVIVWADEEFAAEELQGTGKAVSVGLMTTEELGGVTATVSGDVAALLSFDGAALIPETSLFVIPGNLDVPADTAPGTYTGLLVLSNDSGDLEPGLPLSIVVSAPSDTEIPEGAIEPSDDLLIDATEDTLVVRGELVIGLEVDTADPEAAILALASETGGVFRGSVSRALVYQLEFEAETVEELAALSDELTARPEVEFASLHVIPDEPTTVVPNDTEWDSWDTANPGGNNWGLEYIDAPAAWDLTTGSSDVVVAVIDGDFDDQHGDLDDNVTLLDGYGPASFNDHGTHVAGTACAEGNNGQGITGVAWDCSLQMYGYGSGTVLAQAAMVDAVDNGADIVNMSLGFVENGTCPAPAGPMNAMLVDDANDVLGRALLYAQLQDRDVLWVFAAGNACRDTATTSPASLVDRFPTNTMAIASIDDGGDLSDFSNFGNLITVAAPGGDIGAGVDILSTINRSPCILGVLFCNDQYGFKAGTSMATPHVTGLAALVQSANPSFTASDTKGCILAGAVNGGTQVPGQDFYTINAPAAIECESTVELPDEVDIVISIDLTGSMGGVVNQVKDEATLLIQGLEAAAPTTDFQYSVVTYEDYPTFVDASACALTSYSATYGSSGDEPFRINEALSATPSVIQNAIDALVLGSGFDGPESYTRVLWELGQSDTGATLGFRPDALKLMVNFGDSLPHDPDLDEGVVFGSVSADGVSVPGNGDGLMPLVTDTGLDLGRNGVLDCGGDDIDLQDDALPAMRDAGVRLLHVDSSRGTGLEPYWRFWASETGGAYTTIDGDGTGRPLTEVVIELIGLIPEE